MRTTIKTLSEIRAGDVLLLTTGERATVEAIETLPRAAVLQLRRADTPANVPPSSYNYPLDWLFTDTNRSTIRKHTQESNL